MDNAETLRGARCAQIMAKKLGNAKIEKEAGDPADNLQAAIEKLLWDSKLNVYKWHAGASDGETDVATKAFYPFVMAPAMSVAWLPSSDRKALVYSQVKARLSQALKEPAADGDHWDQVVWLGLAAQGIGDDETLTAVKDHLVDFDPMMESWFRLHCDAHVARILAGDPVTALIRKKH